MNSRRKLVKTVPVLRGPLVLAIVLGCISVAAAEQEIIRTNQPGVVQYPTGPVMYRPGQKPEMSAAHGQDMDFGDGLHTLRFGRVTVRLNDRSKVTLPQLTRLEIIPREADTNTASINL